MADTQETIETTDESERDTRHYWDNWIRAAKAAARQHWLDAREAWEEYETGTKNKTGRCLYPIYKSSCQTLEPAYYSRTPNITTRKLFDFEDDMAGTMCLITERLGHYLVDSFDFDVVIQKVVGDFIHADKCCMQVVHESDLEDQPVRMVAQPAPQIPGGYVDADGKPVLDEIQQDDAGFFYFASSMVPINQEIYLTICPYDEVLHTPQAKCESEITEKAFFFSLTKEAAERKFGKEKLANISWKSEQTKQGENKQGQSDERTPGKFLEGWEIWCDITNKIYTYSEQFADGLLDARADDWELDGFFPSTTFGISSPPSKNLYPKPAYHFLKTTIQNLQDENAKVNQLLDAIDPRALLNMAIPELEALVMAEPNRWIGIKNPSTITDKGGVEGNVFFFPVEPFTNAIANITGLLDRFKNDFFEWFGIPDILRGSTDPVETATAQEVKVSAAHDRFKFSKKLIGHQVEHGVQLMIDLALKLFTDDTMKRVTGFQYMQPDDQVRFQQALANLRSDKERFIRVEIETDTMSFLDAQMRTQNTTEAVTAVTQGLSEVSKMIQISPEIATVGLQTLLASLDTLQVGRQFTDGVKRSLQALIDAAKAPPPPPAPDVEMLKVQVAQQKLANDVQKFTMDAQEHQRKLDMEQTTIMLEENQRGFERNISTIETQLSQRIEQFQEFQQESMIQIEQFKAQMIAKDKELDNQRLQWQAQIDAMSLNLESQQAPAQEAVPAQPPMIVQMPGQTSPPMYITIEASKPGKKIVRTMDDGMGGMISVSEDVPDPVAPVVPMAVVNPGIGGVGL